MTNGLIAIWDDSKSIYRGGIIAGVGMIIIIVRREVCIPPILLFLVNRGEPYQHVPQRVYIEEE